MEARITQVTTTAPTGDTLAIYEDGSITVTPAGEEPGSGAGWLFDSAADLSNRLARLGQASEADIERRANAKVVQHLQWIVEDLTPHPEDVQTISPQDVANLDAAGLVNQGNAPLGQQPGQVV